MEALRIHLFGGFFLERGGVALPPIVSRAGRSLFAYLVMQRGHPLQRDLLAGSFWPDLPDGKARRRLSHTLWQIQDAVSDGQSSHLIVTADTLAFDTTSPYWLDVEDFDRFFDATQPSRGEAVAAADLDAAALRSCVDLYRGDLLAGFFDDWAVVDQDHYRQRYLVALGRLVDVTKAHGAYEEALGYARRLTHYDPLSEEAHQEVMRLCFLLGRISDALQQFDRCRSVLSEEMGAEPSEATSELYEKIVRHRGAGIRPVPGEHRALPVAGRSTTPFVGREHERRSMVDHLERVLAGPGGVVLVEGEPGVGKTRLALEAAEDAQWRGFEVSWGSCTSGALRPFAPLVEVLESLSPLRAEQLSEQVTPVWLSEAMRLAPALGRQVLPASISASLRPAEESSRMKEALVHTLGALGRIAPHLVIVDDVHWADEDTLGVLTQLGPRLAASRIVLLLLYRSEEARGDPEVWDVLRDLDRTAGLGRIVLSPLSVFELGDMVKRFLGMSHLEPASASLLHRRTGGNALFALETLLALRDQGVFEKGDDLAEVLEHQLAVQAIPVAPRVRSVIDSRMSLLADNVSAVYEVAAVCGDPVDIDLLAIGSDLPRRSVVDAVDELLHRGLIRDEGDGRYRMAHDQVRQVVYEGIGRARRKQLHRRLAETLAETTPDDVEAIGHHFREGGVHERAASYLQKAGLRAGELNAYATARTHLHAARLAAAKAAWPPEDQFQVLAHLEAVLSVLGRRSEQREVIEEMAPLTGSSPERMGDIERRSAWLLAHSGDFTGAEEAARRSVRVERKRGDQAALAASLVALGTSLRWSGRPLDAVRHLEAAVEASTGDQRRRAEALTELSSTLVEVQRSAEAMPLLDQALALIRELGDLRGEAELAGIQARALRQDGDRDQAVVGYQRAIELCRRIGYRHGEGVNLVNLSNLHHLLGRVADSLSGYDRAAEIFAELGNLRGEAMVLANAASARHTLLGDDDRAFADAGRAMKHFADIGDRVGEAQCMEIQAGVAMRKGRPDQARGLLEGSLEALAGSGDRALEGQHLRSLARFHLALGEYEAAFATLDRADLLCAEAGLDDLAVELMAIRGATLLAIGRAGEAHLLTRRAVEHLTPGVERPYLVHHWHAASARATGNEEEARRSLSEALRLLEVSLAGLSPEHRAEAMVRVPEHGEIVAAATLIAPRTVEVYLPAVEAPTGRPLEDDETRRVVWTIDHPEDARFVSPIDRRRHRLLRLLAEADDRGAVPAIEHVAAALEVSDSTVRRDLAALREEGHMVSSRGQRKQAS